MKIRQSYSIRLIRNRKLYNSPFMNTTIKIYSFIKDI